MSGFLCQQEVKFEKSHFEILFNDFRLFGLILEIKELMMTSGGLAVQGLDRWDSGFRRSSSKIPSFPVFLT